MKHIDLLEKKIHGEIFFPVQLYRPFLNDYNRTLMEHWHRHMEISYVITGSAVYTINFQDYQVHQGDLIIMPPECLHSGKSISGIHSENLTLLFDPSIFITSQIDICTTNYIVPLFNNDIMIISHIRNSNINARFLVDTIFQINDIFQAKYFGYELQIKSLLYQLLFFLYKYDFATVNQSATLEKKVAEKVKIVIEYINNNYMNHHLYIEDIAKYIGYSTHYLSRFFKKATNISCTEFINKVRIDRATELLCNTEKSITDISFESGFVNVSYFLKKFKEIYHVTPKDYRNAYCTEILK